MTQSRIFQLVTLALLLMAGFWLSRQIPLLLWGSSLTGAVDLRFRFAEWSAFRHDAPLYAIYPSAVYPPASYLMLTPLLGWQSFAKVRLLWALISIIGLAVLGWQTQRGTLAQDTIERCAAFLLPFALHATGVTFGTGQVLLLSLVAIWRVRHRYRMANWLLLLCVPPLLLPVRLSFVPQWVEQLGIAYRTLSWLVMLGFLLWVTRPQRQAELVPLPQQGGD